MSASAAHREGLSPNPQELTDRYRTVINPAQRHPAGFIRTADLR
jgi:hypothetical protein